MIIFRYNYLTKAKGQRGEGEARFIIGDEETAEVWPKTRFAKGECQASIEYVHGWGLDGLISVCKQIRLDNEDFLQLDKAP